MRAVLLSAVPTENESLNRLAGVLTGELAAAGFTTCERYELSSTKLAFCQGEFDCWVKTPGRCRSHDAETAIVRAIHDADALVFLDAVTFGGHGHVLKTAIDRLLCLLEPFFTVRNGLTHHTPRYAHPPTLYAVGWQPRATAEEAGTFDALTDANAVNYLSPLCASAVVDAEHEEAWATVIRGALSRPRVPGATITGRSPLKDELLSASAPDTARAIAGPVRRASLLVGSPKAKGTSASGVLAHAIDARLIAAGVDTTLHHATAFVHDRPPARAAAADLAASELLVLVTPLYVDAFPSLTTHALELIADTRLRSGAPPARLCALVNCGFPEAEQTRTAMRIARHFADAAGYVWAGGLPLGGGGAITPGTSLEKPNGPVANVVRALDVAVPTLVSTGVLPADAIRTMASSVMPDAFYRLFGDLGWRWQAHRNGLAQRDLHAAPLDLH